VFTGILCSALPAVQASDCAPLQALRQGERGSGGRVGQRSRRMLVIVETALSLALLICAGLLINSFYHLRAVDPGFRTERILAAELDLPDAQYKEEQQRKQFVHELMARVSQLPGVGRVGATETLPLHPGNQFWVGFERQGYPLGSWEKVPVVAFAHVTPGYFDAMKIPILRGRAITERDTAESQPAAVISEELRRRHFADQDPIGTRIRLGESSEEPWITVVGVAGDVSLEALDRPKPPYVYVSFDQGVHGVPSDMPLVLDTAAAPLSLASGLRGQVHELDPSLGVADLTTLSSVVNESLDQPRLAAMLMALFAGAAVLLAAIGIYGVLAYAVRLRTKEIGIRVALGARANEVMLLVIRDGLRTTLIGITSGIALAAAGTRALASLLYGVRPLDPFTYVSAAVLLIVIAAVAAYLPARRASHVDPLVALRYE
jgi:putative ABC transport system permease protein